jgi:hypothetical protein
VQVRILYPASVGAAAAVKRLGEDTVPYLGFGFDSAAQFLQFGLPKELAFVQHFQFLLLHWTLVKLDYIRGAKPAAPCVRLLS